MLDDIGLLGNVKVIAVERLPVRYPNQTPLEKIAFENPEQKIRVLKAKANLASSNDYKRVRIWGSKTHAERLIELNFNTLLDAIPDLKSNYRITNHGKVVPLQITDKTNQWPQQKHIVGRMDQPPLKIVAPHLKGPVTMSSRQNHSSNVP